MAAADKEHLPVTPAVIAWARQRAGFSTQDAEKYFKKIAAWEQGEGAPSYPQLESMADKFKVPVAVFFFPRPPEVDQARTSFRTLSDIDFNEIPRPVQGLMRKGQAMQLNLFELNDGRNPARKVITKDQRFAVDDDLVEMAAIIRQYLGVTLEEQWNWANAEDALDKWRNAFVSVGIYVFKDAFHVDGYSGFCLYDDEFPIIYVNNSTTKTRQIFTLFHELAHLLFHTSGIDTDADRYIDHLAPDAQQIEIICNRFANLFLVPEQTFNELVQRFPANRDTADLLANTFKVSREVIYRKLLDRRLISFTEYQEAVDLWNQQAAIAARKKAEKSGGSYYYNQFAYLGTHYIDLALTRYHQQRIGDVKLAEYLNIKPKSLAKFEEQYGGRQ